MNTAATTEIIALISSEASRLRDFMTSLDSEAWSRPSACVGWTVGDVFAHVTQGASTWCETITRAVAGDANPPPGQRLLQPGERGSEVTAQRAIAFRQEQEEQALLLVFTTGYDRLHRVLLGLQPADWDKPCFHRRGIVPTRDYVSIRLQELSIHGWDIRSAFDETAALSEKPLPVLVSRAQRWLANTFRPTPSLVTPVRYRFDISGPVAVQQDVLVSQDGLRTESIADTDIDVTFHCDAGDYILLVYGRLPLGRAMETGRMQMDGSRQRAALFSELFQGV